MITRTWRVLLLAVFLMASFLPSGAASTSQSEELQALLDRRSAALKSGDLPGFLATSSGASSAFQERWKLWFGRVRALGIADYSLSVDLEGSGSFATEGDSERADAEVVIALVQERYVLPGLEGNHVLNIHAFTFVEKGGKWSITSDTDLEHVGRFSDREMWDFGDVRVLKGNNVFVYYHPEIEEFAASVLKLTESALGEIGRGWEQPWSGKVAVFIPTTTEELARMLSATFDLTPFVAFAVTDVDTKDGWEYTDTRVMVHRSRFLRFPSGAPRPPSGQKQILVHELVHVATKSSAGPFIPNWVDEGLAQWTEYSKPPLSRFFGQVKAKRFDSRTPNDYEFLTGTSASILNIYNESLAVVTFMAEKFGIEKVNEFYVALGEARREPGTTEYHLDRSSRAVLGISFPEFEDQWSKWARARAG